MSFRERLGQFLDPRPAKVRPHFFRDGVIVIALLTLLSYVAVTRSIPLIGGESGEPVRAEFAAANQVNARTPVRVAGVDVGTVERVDAGSGPRKTSVVTLRITDDDVQVRDDARAEIRWRSLVGGSTYVDLDPGSPSAPPLGDSAIPANRTSNQVELDDVLQPYEGDTEQALRDALKGLAQGFGDPRGVGRTIEALPALRTVERGIEPLRGKRREDVRRLVASTAKTAEALGHDTSLLQDLVEGAQRTLGATNRRRLELGELIELAPPTLDETHATMTRLRTTLDHLDPLASDLRPGARALAPAASAATPALEQAEALLAEARPLLRQARPTFASLERASRAGVPLLRGLDPTVRRLDTETLPFLHRRDDEIQLRTYEAIGPFFSVLDSSEFDAEGYRLRLSVPAGSNSILTLAETGLTRACRDGPSELQGNCASLGKALAQGWFGRGEE